MGFTSILGFAQQLIRQSVQPNDIVVDATLGTGNDALFLLSQLNKKGLLFGFDVQKDAILRTKSRLSSNITSTILSPFVLFHESHANWQYRIPQHYCGKIGAVMFNLGYLPNGENDNIITETHSTITALQTACHWIRPNGIITIVVYPGHYGGRHESEHVFNWCSSLDQNEFHVLRYQLCNKHDHSPFLLAIKKI